MRGAYGRVCFALLSSDGSIHIAAHSEFDPHTLSIDEMRAIRQAVRNGEHNALVPQRSVAVNGWKIVETIPGAVPFSSDQLPIFFWTQISDRRDHNVEPGRAANQMGEAIRTDRCKRLKRCLRACPRSLRAAGSSLPGR